MITIDIIIKSEKGEICGRQLSVEFSSGDIKTLSDNIADAIKTTIKDIDKIFMAKNNLDKFINDNLDKFINDN